MNNIKDQIKLKAKALGFDFVGIAKVRKLDEESQRLEAWLNKGYHGKMSYMERYFDLRTDPGKLVPGAKSIICLAYNYYSDQNQEDPYAPKISMYAHGKDYHFLLKEKLALLFDFIKQEIGDVYGRIFVDSAPVMERDWAKYAGLGWIGRNTLLINPKRGSYFFLAEIILDLELEPDELMKDYCGTCTRCIDACPTEAIHDNGYLLDASKCISYLTIELRGAIPNEFKGKMNNWMFGCDICQQVCPWNRFAEQHREPWFEPHEDLLGLKKHEWEELKLETFQKLFRKSAVKRTKYAGLMRSIRFLNVGSMEKDNP